MNKPDETPEPTMKDSVSFYRNMLVKAWRFCARFRTARPRTKIAIAAGVLIGIGIVLSIVGPCEKTRRRSGASRFAAGVVEALRPIEPDPAIEASIAAGVSNRLAYVDGYHSSSPGSLLFLKDIGITGFVFREDFIKNRKDLLNSGLLIMGYQQKKRPLSDEEYDLLRTYIANGGRLLFMCPAWVWSHYEKKPIEDLLYNRVGRDFDIVFSGDYVKEPFKIVHRWFETEGMDAVLKNCGTFSDIRYKDAYPVLVGGNGRTAAVAVESGKSRLFAWGQNDMLKPQVFESAAGAAFLKQVFDWLLDDSVDLSRNIGPEGVAAAEPAAIPAPKTDADIARSIAAGVSNRAVYVNGFHAVPPDDLSVFEEAGAKPTVYRYQGFEYNRDALFNSGLMVMMYQRSRRSPSEAEYGIIRQYINNGGRLLLACPAWVWETYEKKPITDLPYDIIVREFGLVMDSSYVKPPLRNVHPKFDFGDFLNKKHGTYSAIGHVSENAVPILVGGDGQTAAVAATKGEARVILWAQDNLLKKQTVSDPAARKAIIQMINWLLE